MMNNSLKTALNAIGLPQLSETGKHNYSAVLNTLGVSLESSASDFFLSYDESGFIGKSYQIYHICWAYINTDDYNYLLKNLWEKRPWGTLPRNYVPLSSFEGEKIFLYNCFDNSVSLVDEGQINAIIAQNFVSQWSSFDKFLAWFFNV